MLMLTLISKTMEKRNTSYFLIQIDHHPKYCPEGIAAKMVGGQGSLELKVLEVDGNSKKEFPYIAS